MKIKPYSLFAITTALSTPLALAEPPRPVGPPDPFAPRALLPHNFTRPVRSLPEKPQPFLGLVTDAVNSTMSAQLGLPDGVGLVIGEVLPDSPAARAGLQQHDILKQINDQLLTAPEQLATLVRYYGKNSGVTLTLIRKGEERKITATIGERLMPERQTTLLRDPPGGRNELSDLLRENLERGGAPLPH
nr:PDZ domain-containing protein [Verrucomicrobiota bacterium]